MKNKSSRKILRSTSDVIDALGGTNAVAARFGLGASAVSNWRRLFVFPARVQMRMLNISAQEGINIDPDLIGLEKSKAAAE